MKKITLLDFDKNRKQKTKRWLGWLTFCMMVFGQMSFAQINHTQDFTSNNGGYTGNFTQFTGTTACGGEGGAMRRNMYGTGANATGELITPLLGVSSGLVATVSFDYKVANWSANTVGTPASDFTITVQYGATATGPWTDIYTIDDHVVSGSCATRTYTFTPTAGDDLYVRFYGTRIGGDFYMNFDNISVTQAGIPCSGIPVAGTATATPDTGNSGSSFTANATGVTVAGDMEYQWQKSTDGEVTWTDITGATSIESVIVGETGAVGTVTHYRLSVTCTNSSETTYSNSVTHTLVMVYCTPITTGTYYLSSVSTTGGSTNISHTATAKATGGYADLTATEIVTAYEGQEIGISLSANSSTHYFFGWIDADGNGTFDNTTEKIIDTSTDYLGTWNGTLTIPNLPLGDYRIRIGSSWSGVIQPCGSANGEYKDFTLTVEAQPACLPVTALTATTITYNQATLGWTSAGTSFDIELVEAGTTPTGTATYTGQANPFTTPATLTPSTDYEFYVRQNCTASSDGVSTWEGPFAFTTECLPPSVLTTTPGTRCGEGTVELSATTDAGASIGWYATQTGGAQLGNGEDFTTPSITETTSYWVAAYTGQQLSGQGKPAYTATGAGYGQTAGVVFTATEAFTIVDVEIFADAAGTIPSIQLQDSSGNLVPGQEITGFVIPSEGQSSASPLAVTVPLNFEVPGAGTYRLLLVGTTAPALKRDASGNTYPYALGTVGEITGGWLTTSASTTYYFFYNWSIQTGCYSTRTEVIATVTNAPAFALSETTVDICEGETTDTIIVTTGVSDYDTYAWEPTTGVSGDATNGWTFNPTETTTYTLTASQSSGAECVVTAEVQVNVNPLPMAITVIGTEEICENGIIELSVTGNINNGTAVLGDGITAPANTANAPNPLSSYYGGAKHQMLYTAAELTAQGMIPGSIISEVTFDLAGTGGFCTDFTIRMGATTVDVMSSGFVSGTTTVYGPATFTPTSIGLVSFELTTPYVWDGISNLVVETVHNAGNTGNGSGSNTRYTETLSNSVAYIRSDNTSGGIAGFDALTTTPTFSNFRPNMTFVHSLEQTNITWSPATALYTDEDATIPYVAETYSTTVYFKSSTEGNFNYTATSYTDFDCSVSDDIVITVNEAPEQPVLACYETATFNAATCQWEVSGEQPEQPVIACYETATFNDATCEWDVTGEQPEQPVIACYETATFNDATCEWDVTGDQPEEPVIACYETTTFNEVTCEWEVTGTAPATPTANSPQNLTNGQTVADIVVTDVTGILTWYLDSDLTTVIDETFEFSEGSYTFWVTQTIDGCESDAIAIEVEVTLNRNDFDNASFRTYPNPVKDVFYVSYSKEITSVSVVNILGQTVIEKSVNATDTQIDMTSLPTGSYFVKVTVEGNSKTVKVIKQ